MRRQSASNRIGRRTDLCVPRKTRQTRVNARTGSQVTPPQFCRLDSKRGREKRNALFDHFNHLPLPRGVSLPTEISQKDLRLRYQRADSNEKSFSAFLFAVTLT